MIAERCIAKYVEGNGHTLMEVLFWNLPGGTEDNNEKSQSRNSM
jgi:hypothetical protein